VTQGIRGDGHVQRERDCPFQFPNPTAQAIFPGPPTLHSLLDREDRVEDERDMARTEFPAPLSGRVRRSSISQYPSLDPPDALSMVSGTLRVRLCGGESGAAAGLPTFKSREVVDARAAWLYVARLAVGERSSA
jgi:hypothetical protein